MEYLGAANHALRIQILSTEHWSLLATRSLTYSESFSRVAMFISVLSGAMIAIALVAEADHFGRTFAMIAILILVTVLFVGLATIGRIQTINKDDLHWVIGMNRIRRVRPDCGSRIFSSRGGASGLGLQIDQRLLERHVVEIRASSALSKN